MSCQFPTQPTITTCESSNGAVFTSSPVTGTGEAATPIALDVATLVNALLSTDAGNSVTLGTDGLIYFAGATGGVSTDAGNILTNGTDGLPFLSSTGIPIAQATII